MAEPFRIITGDPQFNPREPIMVNGYLFVPAEGYAPVTTPKPRRNTMVHVKRRKLVEVGRD